MKRLYLSLLLLTLCRAPLDAQEQGMPANCHGMLTATLASGRAHGGLAACGAVLGDELADAIRRAERVADTVRLGRILSYSYSIRDPDVFEAALRLANNRGSNPAARALGLALAVAQYDPRLSFQGGGRSPGSLFSAVPSPECSEIAFLPESGNVWHDAGPAEAVESRLRATVEALRGRDEPSLLLRGLARCAALLVPESPAPALPGGSITVSCTCEDFVITNNTGERLELEYVLESTPPEHGTIVLLPRGRELVLHDRVSSIRVLQNGRLVASREPPEAGCETP